MQQKADSPLARIQTAHAVPPEQRAVRTRLHIHKSVGSYYGPGGDRLRCVAYMMLASLPLQLAAEVKIPMNARMIFWKIQHCKTRQVTGNVVAVCNDVVGTETPYGKEDPPALKTQHRELSTIFPQSQD